LGVACKLLIDSSTQAMLEKNFFEPFFEGWDKAFPELQAPNVQTYSTEFDKPQVRQTYYERAMELEKRSAALWEIQHPNGVNAPPAIYLANTTATAAPYSPPTNAGTFISLPLLPLRLIKIRYRHLLVTISANSSHNGQQQSTDAEGG